MVRNKRKNEFVQPPLCKAEGVELFDKEIEKPRPSSSSAYIFPWSHFQRGYDLNSYDPVHSQGTISSGMVNALFEDVYRIELLEPVVFNLLSILGWFNMVFSMLFGMVYLIWGVATAYYKYEISTDGDKRYIDKSPQNARLADALVVGFSLLVAGAVFGSIMVLKVKQIEYCRLAKRKRQINKVLQKHQSTTFEGTGAKLEVSELGGLIKIVLPEKPAEAAEDSDEERLGLKTKAVVPVFEAKVAVQPGTSLGEAAGSHNPAEVNESAQLLAPHQRDQEAAFEVPEEQPL